MMMMMMMMMMAMMNCFCVWFTNEKRLVLFTARTTVEDSLKAVVQRCSVKKVLLEISQNSQENTCARVSFLIKLQASGIRSTTLLKKRLWHWCFSLNFAKFLRTLFLTEHLWWLLLIFIISNL